MTEPQRWVLPPEPGPEVTAVRNSVGELWVRQGDQWAWQPPEGPPTHARGWRELLVNYGPLSDATQETK